MSNSNPIRLPDGMFVHAAAVVVSDGAILLLGHSGAGKSTLCQLLEKQYPTLVDDLCFLMRSGNGSWCVVEPKKSWEDGLVPRIPLRAVLRIFQSSKVKLSRIPPRETCRHLVDGVFEVQLQQKANAIQKRVWLANSAEIAKLYTGWRLEFPIAAEVVGILRSEFDSQSFVGKSLIRKE
jgi:energy-coupling factor transporter ATP-binding protein EcfA2